MDHTFEHDGSDERLTQEEAEKVIELWARLQQERDAKSGMPEVGELAEVLGASEEDVRRLLGQVRAESAAPVSGVDSGVQLVQVVPAETMAPKKRRAFLWGGASALLLAGIFLSVVIESETGVAGQPVMAEGASTVAVDAAMAPAVPAGETVAQVDVGESLPEGVHLRVDGVAVVGTSQDAVSSDGLREGTISGLYAMFDRWVSVPRTNDASLHNTQDLLDGLGRDKGVMGLVKYIPVEVRVSGKVETVMIPVSTSSDAKYTAIIDSERELRIRKLADWVVEQAGPATFKVVADR